MAAPTWTIGDALDASKLNLIRDDIDNTSTGHTHNGTDSKSVASATPVATGTANAGGSAATAAKSDHVHQTVLAYFSDVLGADVTMTNANTPYTVLSRSLVAGTWLILAQGASDAGGTTVRLDNGAGTYYAHMNDVAAYGFHLSTVAVLGSTTTMTLTARNTSGGKKVLAIAASNGDATADQTRLTCIRIA